MDAKTIAQMGTDELRLLAAEFTAKAIQWADAGTQDSAGRSQAHAAIAQALAAQALAADVQLGITLYASDRA